MGTDNIIMKGRLFGAPYSAVDLWEFRRELTLTKRLIKCAENCIEQKETHSADSYEGVCFYIARSIIAYAKSAFDNLVLGHFDTTEMVTRAMVENRVILELIFDDDQLSLWKYYLVYSHYKSIGQSHCSSKDRTYFDRLCTDLRIASDFLENRGDKKPYIELQYGWTYRLDSIKPENRFKFKGLCDAVEGKQQNYDDFQWMSKSVHGTSYFEKVTGSHGAERIISLFTSIYINLYLLVVMYCDGIWGEDFDLITDELETIFHHFIEVYDNIYQ